MTKPVANGSNGSSMPKMAAIMGYAGLIPFFAGALAHFSSDGNLAAYSELLVVSYGALILSFLGGINWGLYLAKASEARADWLVIGVLPSLMALLALLVAGIFGKVLLLLGFIAIFIDHKGLAAALELPAWFIRLRTHLTLGACASIAVIAFIQPYSLG